jgi:protein phosphatase
MTDSNTDTNRVLKISHAGISMTGKRDYNQDAILVKVPTTRKEIEHKGIVVCIADGVSCSSQSQQASHAAVVQFINDYFATPYTWSIAKSATTILKSINSWLFEEGLKKEYTHEALVTTFSCLIIKSNTAYIFHVGDTRIYHCRGETLTQLTTDHQRMNFGKSAYLTRGLGMDSQLKVDYQAILIEKNDKFILSSDGVHDYIDNDELVKLALCNWENAKDLEFYCDNLCHSALAQGSRDNLSCLLVDINDLPKENIYEHQQQLSSKAIPPALDIGNTIDSFRVDSIIHQGARSHVYRVSNIQSSEVFVLKAPSIQCSDDIEYLRCFSNESWVGQQIKHPRIVTIYDTGNSTKFIYQLSEFIDGITLRQWMYDNPSPSLHRVRDILDAIVKATRVLQRADMVHRDIKPENIMITDDGNIKLIDLGSVKVASLEESNAESFQRTPLGDTKYIAPEYVKTGESTILSDLFSIAAIGYEMLTSNAPYHLKSEQNLNSARHTKWVYKPIKNYRDDIPDWVNLAFKKALQENPQRRYQALGEFICDLYKPNKLLQAELHEAPLAVRNPVLYWKLIAITSTTIAFIEFLFLL